MEAMRPIPDASVVATRDRGNGSGDVRRGRTWEKFPKCLPELQDDLDDLGMEMQKIKQ